LETEPCPFCGNRMVPIKWGEVKICTICGRRWFETGGSWRRYRGEPPTSGGGGAEAAVV